MWSRYTFISVRIVALLLACASPFAFGESVEKALMPGQVIQGHAKYEEECSNCHERGNPAGQVRLCLSCHKEVAADVKGKQHFHGHLVEANCRSCHTDHKGRNAKIVILDKKHFDHKSTGLPLKGAHLKLLAEKCDSCHAPQKPYRQASTECNSCHAKDDMHKGSLGPQCAQCHSEDTWKHGKFDHDKTRFQLEGGHRETACKECHADAHYKNTPRDCYSCHKKDDQKDGHKGQFGTKCETCHIADSWDVYTFDHNTETHYLLKGKHEDADCTACHTTKLYVPPKTPNTCVACHRKDDNEKGHKGALGPKCESCHAETGWKKTNFDHDRDTEFKLLGKHHDVKCDDCHVGGLKPQQGKAEREKLPLNCVGCHRKLDQEKGHKGKFGDKCDSCHNNDDWKKPFFDHDKDTHYVLKGKHIKTACQDCHKGTLYVEKLTSDCISCHRTTDMDSGHKGQLGPHCEKCHDEKQWKGISFDHNKSRFPLTGKHISVECKACHKAPTFRDAKMTCVSCHIKDDVHKKKFGSDCVQCHNTRNWKAWDFDHQQTRYPLKGGHIKAKCEDCHQLPMEGKISLSTSCIDCHSTQDVHHGGFGVQCDRCHTEDNWKAIRR